MDILLTFCPEDVRETLTNAKTPEAYYESRSFFFLTDGTFVVAEKDSAAVREFNKALSSGNVTDDELKKEKYSSGGYKITATDDENEYTVMASGGTSFTYNVEEKRLIGAHMFEEEVYDLDTRTVPEYTNNYDYSAISTGGEIEKKYMGYGNYTVSSDVYREKDSQSMFIHKVWYPTELVTNTEGKKYPLVVMSNGTGTICTAYEYVFKHLASWGFIVVGNDEWMSYEGRASETSLTLMLSLNEDKNSKFYNKIDTDNIGGAGHSQGGCGAIKAVLNMEHGDMYKALYIASNTPTDDSTDEVWYYDAEKIKIPYFAVAGTGDTDAGNGTNAGLASLASLQSTYDKISSSDKMIARRKDADHGEMLTYGDAYMTAWFMWHLKGDEEAKAAFYGENAEILSNKQWQDISKSF